MTAQWLMLTVTTIILMVSQITYGKLEVARATSSSSSKPFERLHGPVDVPDGWVEMQRNATMGNRNDTIMEIHIGLERNETKMRELKRLVDEEIANPDSERFTMHFGHQEILDFVTPDDGNETMTQIDKWLAAHGVANYSIHRHGDSLEFSADVETIEALLNVTLSPYQNAKGQVLYRNPHQVNCPSHLTGKISTITGTQSFPGTRQGLRHLSTSSDVSPQTIQAQYNMPANLGSEITTTSRTNIAAIAEFQGEYFQSTDLQTACTYFNIGTCSIDQTVGSNSGTDSTESNLDVQYIKMVNDNAVETWVYGFQSMDFCNDILSLFSALVNSATYPSVVSISYGIQRASYCSQAVILRAEQEAIKLAAMGVTIVVASGDNGSGYYLGSLNPSWPSTIPYVLAVGATTIQGSQETATTSFGSGGGFSYDYDLPSYQNTTLAGYWSKYGSSVLANATSVSINANSGGVIGRATPDIAALGQNYLIFQNGNLYTVSGTSASTPAVASMIALLNQMRLASGYNTTIGFINPTLYKYPELFVTDITEGNNFNSNANLYSCEPGYDPVTGLGTPNFSKLQSVLTNYTYSSGRVQSPNTATSIHQPFSILTSIIILTWNYFYFTI